MPQRNRWRRESSVQIQQGRKSPNQAPALWLRTTGATCVLATVEPAGRAALARKIATDIPAQMLDLLRASTAQILAFVRTQGSGETLRRPLRQPLPVVSSSTVGGDRTLHEVRGT